MPQISTTKCYGNYHRQRRLTSSNTACILNYFVDNVFSVAYHNLKRYFMVDGYDAKLSLFPRHVTIHLCCRTC